MDPNPPALYPNLPTLEQALGSDWTMGAWRGCSNNAISSLTVL